MHEDEPIKRLVTKEFRTVSQIRGPLIFVERVSDVAYDEMVEVIDPAGRTRVGRVLEIDNNIAVIQLFLSTEGLDITRTRVRFSGDVIRLNVSHSMLGRILDGLGNPIDGGPAILPEKLEDINGKPLNPAVRIEPSEFIQTGISSIDGLNSLARGQKLPIFFRIRLARQRTGGADRIASPRDQRQRRPGRTFRGRLRCHRHHPS
jgi:V/A-type H+-transporting ATPase subunit B